MFLIQSMESCNSTKQTYKTTHLHSINKCPPFDENTFTMWISMTMIVLQTMDYHMMHILADSLYIPMRTMIEANETPTTVHASQFQWTKENKKLVKHDVRARENSLAYEFYHMVENYNSY